MHKDRTNREFFAVTMNDNQPGQILRSGVLSVLPTNSGPKKIHPDDYSRDPALAGGPVNLAVEVDGTRSAAAPSGTDFAGKTAPNSVTVQYLSDGMDSSGLVVSSVSSSGDIVAGFTVS